MGIIYEHWRLDTNECFYIGKSMAKDPYARANQLDKRSSYHQNIINKLRPLNLIEIRVSEFPGITKNALNNLEILAIAHWQFYIGKRLANRTPGGESGDYWTLLSELERSKIREKMSLVAKNRLESMSLEEKQEFIKISRERFTNWWASLTEEERDNFCKTRAISQQRRWDEISDADREAHRESTRKAVLEYYAHITDEEYAHLCEINREKSLMFWENISEEELAERCRNLSEKSTQMWANRTEEEIAEVSLAISKGHKNRSSQDVEKSHQKRIKTLAEKDALAKASGKLTRAEKIRESHLTRTDEDVAESHRKRVEVRRQKDLELKALGLPTSSDKAWETRRRKKAEALAKQETP